MQTYAFAIIVIIGSSVDKKGSTKMKKMSFYNRVILQLSALMLRF
jgi:hypothetical protein